MKGDVDEDAEEVVRLVFNRVFELRTEEKVDVNGEAEVVLLEEPGRRADGSSEVGTTLVDKGVSPRRVPAVEAGSPQADCRGLADPALDEFVAAEATEF